MEISFQTLIVAVQVVEEKYQRVSSQVKEAKNDELSDMEQALFELSKARDELKKSYTQMSKQSDNVPNWQTIVSDVSL